MPTFQVSTYPAKCEGNSTQIAVTNCIARTTVECTMAELPAKLKEIAEAAPVRTILDMPHIHAWAKPVGRAPNGYKAFEARSLNEYNHIPAAAPAGWDKIEA